MSCPLHELDGRYCVLSDGKGGLWGSVGGGQGRGRLLSVALGRGLIRRSSSLISQTIVLILI